MGKPVRDLTGQKFGRWTAIRRVEKPEGVTQTGAYWLFQCECGTLRVKKGGEVVNKKGSCGCLKSEVNSKLMRDMQLKKYGTIEERFLSRFKKVKNGCWIWTAHSDKDGYGILPTSGAAIRAHRFSFEYFNKVKIKKGQVVCHHCDNPSCVNPDHLFVGTVKDNCQDMLSKDRDAMIGVRNNKAKLSNLDVIEIKLSKEGTTKLSKKYGVCNSTIKRIRSGKSWRHLNEINS